MDGPIWVNHYVHAFRVAVIVERWWDKIILNDWKIWWDALSASGSCNNWYMKENKHYYVSSFKNIHLKRGDILTMQCKIDANVSRPKTDVEPMTLWNYNTPASTRDTWDHVAPERHRPFDPGRNWSNGTRVQYWTTGTPNWNADAGIAASQYNWYAYANDVVLDWTHSWCSPYIPDAHNLNHGHTVPVMLPPIPPHAPNYVNWLQWASVATIFANAPEKLWWVAPVAEWDRPSLLYPGKFMANDTNSDNNAILPYQPGKAAIQFIWPSTGWDWWVEYPAMPATGPDYPYDNISKYTWFMFGVRRQQAHRSSQDEPFI
jgi:hypothetical protein